MTSFADLTTIGVGGPIATFLEPTTRVGVIEAVEEAERDAVGARVDVGRDQPAHPGDLASVRAEALA